MRDEVFKDLNSCHPRLSLVRYSCLAADTHDHLVVMHTIDEVLEGIGVHFRVRVDL